MRFTVLFGALAALLATGEMAEGRTLTPSEKTVIRDAVSERFFDPDSAKFRWLPLPSKFEGGVYCGSVNAKNRFGAYTGYGAFVVIVGLKHGSVTEAGSLTAIRDYDADVYRELCAQKGFDIGRAR
jgi:hypothetical protein